MIRVMNCSADEFASQLKRRKVICICAGREFTELCEEYNLDGRILYAVDRGRSGTVINVGGSAVAVRSLEEIGEEAKNCILVITSLKYADEVIRELDQIPALESQSCYVSKLFLNDPRHFLPAEKSPPVIPKLIHYCWFGKGEMPEEFQRNIETWKACCPGYQILRWDESNYDVSQNRYMEQAYASGKWGFVPDYARLDIVCKYGGVYLDTDVALLQSYDRLLGYDFFCGFESARYIALGLGFGAKKGSVILRDMMEQYASLEFIRPDGSFALTASPAYQTSILEKYGLVRNGRTQMTKDFLALSQEFLSPFNAYGFGQTTERTISIHQFASTWYGDQEQRNKERCSASCRYVMERMEQDSRRKEE